MKRLNLTILCALGGVAALAVAPAFADQNAGSHRPYYHEMGMALSNPSPVMALGAQDYQTDTSTTIALDGKDVLRIRNGASGYTAQQRAEAIRLRLDNILSIPNLSASDVRIVALPAGERAITVRGELLATIDSNLASQNSTTADELAQTWADNLRQTLPASNVAP